MYEKALVALEQPPWGAIYRIIIGYMLLSVFRWLMGSDASPWQLFVWFVAVLLMMRVVPLLIRKVLPFSKEVSEIWWRRRQLAKDYDSYQWRKLFWIGIGMVGYMSLFRIYGGPFGLLAGFCLLVGGIGSLLWQCSMSSQEPPSS